jgi:ABC-type transport system substrate-binding protein
LKEALRILYDDVAYIPILYNISVFITKKNIENTPTLKQSDPLMLIKEVKIRK